MSTSSTSSFTGQSSFSSDFQNVISRAVQIASLPMTQLQNEQSSLTGQQSELQTLGNGFQSLQNALSAVGTATGSGSYGATVSNTSVATASVSSGVLAGSYAVNIVNLGAETNTISSSSLPTVSDPSSSGISASSSYTLTVGSHTYDIAPAGSDLNSLVKAINASGANVQATVVNVGGSTNPNYLLSIQGTQYSPDSIQLNDGKQDLLNTITSGAYVQYQVNGQPSTPATSTSRSLSISTGLTVNALATGSANVTVSQNSSSIGNALSSFVASFNSTVDELTKNRGQNGGALAGNSVISELSAVLHNVATYSSAASSGIQSLSDIGLSFDQNGHLQLDASSFASAASSSLSGVLSFLGSASGGGFLGAATSALQSATDSTTGVITQASNSIGTTIQNLTSKISADQTYVSQLQTNLTAQMAKADATVASLQQQVTQITNLFAAMQQNSKNITG